jgi:pimeloyl-ACP methyl ester carboxylesterase
MLYSQLAQSHRQALLLSVLLAICIQQTCPTSSTPANERQAYTNQCHTINSVCSQQDGLSLPACKDFSFDDCLNNGDQVSRIPLSLQNSYVPLPEFVRIVLLPLVSVLLAYWTNQDKESRKQDRSPQSAPARSFFSSRLGFIMQVMMFNTIATLILQEFIAPPSRVSTQDLATNYTLPSKLSRYESINLPRANTSMGVHYMQYDNADVTFAQQSAQQQEPGTVSTPSLACAGLYMNHGFGASSLSWLPAMEFLAQALHCPTAMAHDMPGFGLTDRPVDMSMYSLNVSAEMGIELVKRELDRQAQSNLANNSSQAPLILMGHSMGSITTLKMALELSQDAPIHVILVSPALGYFPQIDLGASLHYLHGMIRRPLAYLLRRLVGLPDFWKLGLKVFWGDLAKVRPYDYLRFAWPGIAEGWEDGLIKFLFNFLFDRNESEADLLQAVLDMGIAVDVIVGSRDRLVWPSHVEKFMRGFSVDMHYMEGSGHDPFEEDTLSFVQLVHSIAQKYQ